MTQPKISTFDNVDLQEIARFNALASRWWDENSEFRPLHRINPHRLQWINQLTPLSGKLVLDVGCGGGILSESMARLGATVTGIDLAKKPLEIARWHAQSGSLDVNYQEVSAEAWATQHHSSYDVITCMEMLEHVPNPHSVITACAQMVRPGGWVFFSTLNRNFLSYLIAILGAEYVLKILPKGSHTFNKFIKPTELLNMAAPQKLQLRDQKGLVYNPLTQNFKLSQFMGVAYLLAMQKAET